MPAREGRSRKRGAVAFKDPLAEPFAESVISDNASDIPRTSLPVSPTFSFSQFSWVAFLFGCVLAYGGSFLIRAQEYVYWQGLGFSLNGQYLMSTHDAYAWLAGAIDVNGFLASQPLSQMLALWHSLSGTPVADIGFWMPALFAPLAAIPVCLLACWLGGCEFAAVAGLLASTSMGYMIRTRLGSLDTDLYTLLFPVLLAGGVLVWLDRSFDLSWRLPRMARKGEAAPQVDKLPKIWGGAVLLGLMCQFYYLFYASGLSIMLATLGVAGLVGFFLAAPGLRLTALCAAGLSTAPLFLGWPGVAIAAVLAGAVWKKPEIFARGRVLWAMLGIFAVLVVVFEGDILRGMLNHALTWLKPTHVGGGVNNASAIGASLQLPGIRQSVREAQNAPLGLVIEQMSGHWSIFCAGLVGYIYLCRRLPACLTFLPLLLLGLASARLGYRFSMYGGPTIGLGFVGLGLAVKHISRIPRVVGWAVGMLLLAVVLVPLWGISMQLRPSPVLDHEYARTLEAASNATEKDGWLWQWWDYGYAAQFYGKRYTFADGGRNYSNWVYPLAKVHTATSPRAAAQLMHTFAAEIWKQARAESDGGAPSVPEIFNLELDPIESLEKMGAGQAQKYMTDLADRNMPVSKVHPPQYLVFSWDNLKLAGWISDFGSWNIATGGHARGQIGTVGGEVSINTQTGTLNSKEYPPLKICELAVVSSEKTDIRKWPDKEGLYVVMNSQSSEVYVMTEDIYKSMMVQMLIMDPNDFAPYFRLVVENAPWGRIYKLAD